MFSDIQIWGFSVDVVNAVLSIAVVVLPILSALIVTALVGAQALPAFRKLVRSLREYVDQPTDSAVKFLAEKLGVTEEQVIAALTKVIDEMGREPVAPAPDPVATKILEYTMTFSEAAPGGTDVVYPTMGKEPVGAAKEAPAPLPTTSAVPETLPESTPVEAVP